MSQRRKATRKWRVYKACLESLARMAPSSQLRTVLLRWAGCEIGRRAYIGPDLIVVDEPEDVGVVSIGDRAAISPRVTIVVSSRPNESRIARYAPLAHGPVRIMQDAWIGAGCIIMPNVTVGEGAIVGAGSLVTRDVPPYTVVVGSPARPVRKIEMGQQIDKEKSGGD
jgi:acetyltransferase-like isoleucine patch superfamily enzyme